MNTAQILVSIPASRPCTFNELVQALDDEIPRDLFQTLEAFESLELVKIDRSNGRITQLALTALGAERAREVLKGDQ